MQPADTGGHEPEIRSAANPRIRAIARLRDRRGRVATGRTLIDGARELLTALDAGVQPEEVLACRELVRAPAALAAIERLGTLRAPLRWVSPAVIGKLTYGSRSDGLLAVVPTPSLELGALRLGADPLILVAEGLEKPGNLGAILRSADGAGAAAVIAADPRTDLFNPNAVRASLGTIFTVPLAAGPSSVVRAWLVANAVRIVAARPDALRPPGDLDLTGSLAIVVGAESEGLSDAWTGADVSAVGIPMLGVADSLNVSAASAVLLYEARRQRGIPERAGRSLRAGGRA